MDAAADVRFDFPGSLSLARTLWSLAEELDSLASSRNAEAATALTTWMGIYGTQFAERITAEVEDLALAAGELRAAAGGWAAAWAEAMNEQNRRLFARQVNDVEDNRSLGDNVHGFFFGHDDLPPQPDELGVPQSPHFAATGSFVRY